VIVINLSDSDVMQHEDAPLFMGAIRYSGFSMTRWRRAVSFSSTPKIDFSWLLPFGPGLNASVREDEMVLTLSVPQTVHRPLIFTQ
jgi:hypothetical protein